MSRTLTGEVQSTKANKTIVVAVRTRKTHPVYKKQYSVTKRFMAHDEKNEAKEGDKVIIIESRPISARKRFTLLKIIETAHIKHVEPEEVPAEEPEK
jgi:small subunit ribosomal protein S17